MKVVLFCGGRGTRIREYSENIPKPLIPLGGQPIMRHVMQYYASYGHDDFVLCLGYKANVIKDFFLNSRPESYGDCVISGSGSVEMLGALPRDWRVALIDTGVWRNIGERLWAVRDQVKGEKMFLANYSDGLTDVDLDDMIDRFEKSDKLACFLAVKPPLTYHLADIDETGNVRAFRSSENSEMRINAGFFLMRAEIFDYMRDGEELVLEPFARLIADNKLMAYKYDGFWRSMDTFRDWQTLEAMVERGDTPWMQRPAATGQWATAAVKLP
jgi:glucose-1-phosphate cytidylyltransferase